MCCLPCAHCEMSNFSEVGFTLCNLKYEVNRRFPENLKKLLPGRSFLRFSGKYRFTSYLRLHKVNPTSLKLLTSQCAHGKPHITHLITDTCHVGENYEAIATRNEENNQPFNGRS